MCPYGSFQQLIRNFLSNRICLSKILIGNRARKQAYSEKRRNKEAAKLLRLRKNWWWKLWLVPRRQLYVWEKTPNFAYSSSNFMENDKRERSQTRWYDSCWKRRIEFPSVNPEKVYFDGCELHDSELGIKSYANKFKLFQSSNNLYQ